VPFIVTIVTLAGCAGQPREIDRADRPVIRVGDSWSYDRYGFTGHLDARQTHTVVQIDATQQTFTERVSAIGEPGRPEPPEREWTVTRSAESLVRMRRDLSSRSPFLDFPLVVGKSWDVYWDGQGDSGAFYGRGSAKVVAEETVEVPAGRFTALRIRYQSAGAMSTGRGHRRWLTEDVWYVPRLKRWARYDYLAFGAGAASSLHDRYRLELREFKITGD
jgi:hypothetical protein